MKREGVICTILWGMFPEQKPLVKFVYPSECTILIEKNNLVFKKKMCGFCTVLVNLCSVIVQSHKYIVDASIGLLKIQNVLYVYKDVHSRLFICII